MARPVKKSEEAEVKVASEVKDNEKVQKPDTKANAEEIPERVRDIMRLNPQYKRLWITKKGFVHPEGVPEALTKDAKLYTNIFNQ